MLGEFDPPKEDFRGVWLTTVANLDWPMSNTQSSPEQMADAIAMLDSLKKIGINAVLFQVRPESDALYASSYDPWSYWLTGEQGRAPNPFYDPLSFMIREAHSRGMELHAWLNPYRVERRKGAYDLAGSNISRREPGWVLQFQNRPGEFYTMLNPGMPEVRDYVTNVVVDIVRRYDVDGIHFDDYFYPYSPMTNEDSLTFLQHHHDIPDIEDWRRFNVNALIAQVHDSLQALAPHISFGISPFAVRKNSDAGTTAFEGYYQLYADGLAWLEERTIDYINPQLYFYLEHERAPYGPLLDFWSGAAYKNQRHMYAGLAPYRIYPPHDWSLDQALDQLRLNMANGWHHGNIYFRTQHLMSNPKGYSDVLRNELYRYPALTPSMPWKSQARPPPVDGLAASWSDDGRVILSWSKSESSSGAGYLATYQSAHARTARYVVYSLDMSDDEFAEFWQDSGNDPSSFPDPERMLTAPNVMDVTGQRQWVDSWADGQQRAVYVVTSVSHNSIESAPVILKATFEDGRFVYKVRM